LASRIQKFMADRSRTSASIRALEKCSPEFVFEVVKASAQRGLPDVQREGRLTKAAMLSSDKGPT
jgi:hypothetical protein